MNKKGISAVIEVILMVAITVAIAGTVYIYVYNRLDFQTYSYEGKIDAITPKEYTLLHTTDEYCFSTVMLDDRKYELLKIGFNHNCTVGFSYVVNYEDIYVIQSGTIYILDCCNCEGSND